MSNDEHLTAEIKRELDQLKIGSFDYVSLAKLMSVFTIGYTIGKDDRGLLLHAFKYVNRVRNLMARSTEPDKIVEAGFARLEASVSDIRAELAKDTIRLDALERLFPSIRRDADRLEWTRLPVDDVDSADDKGEST